MVLGDGALDIPDNILEVIKRDCSIKFFNKSINSVLAYDGKRIFRGSVEGFEHVVGDVVSVVTDTL